MESRTNRPGFPWHLLAVFVPLAAGTVAVGYFYYRTYEQDYRTEVERQLLTVAQLKTDALAEWREERLGYAAILFKNAAFSSLVRRWFQNPQDQETQHLLRTWMGLLQAHLQHDRICLLDAKGVQRVSVPDTPEPVGPHVARDAAEALRSGEITFLDFHRDAPDKPVRLAILVPVLDEADGDRPIGVLVMKIDPDPYLYPFISRWPTPSETAETLIICRDGDDALLLNELRFQQNTALSLHVPLTEAEQPVVMAALGREGIVEGVDYRGVPVIAAVRAVPDSPWFLVARMDASEVYAPLRGRLWLTVVLVGAMLLAAGATVGLVWRQQRVRFYREKAEAAQALRGSEIRYRRLFEAAQDGILVMDAETGAILDVNPCLLNLLGFSREQFLERKIWEVGFLKDIVANQVGFAELRGKGYFRHEGLPLRTADGRRIDVEFISNVYQVNHAAVMQCNIRDITDRKRAEEATQKAQAELLEERQHEKEHAEAELARMRDRLVRATRLAAIGQVSASIAHDLRNPLGTVRNAAYYLGRRLPQGQPEVAEYLGIINQEVAAADRIITNLLAVARAKEPVKQHVDLGQAIREVLAETGQAEAVRLRMSLAPEPFVVRADPDQLRQVFRNLVTNAVDAMDGGGEIVVEAAREADGDSIVLRDTGPGVAQEIRETVFEPLVTTRAKGIGLGLTICRQIIERHGGGIELIDEDKPGAAFRIRLPR